MKKSRYVKNVFVIKYDAIFISCITILFGILLLLIPELMNNYQTYAILAKIFNNYMWGFLFMCTGIIKIVGIILNNPRLRALGISLIMAIWMLFMVAIFISGVLNTVWVLCLAMIFWSIGVVVKERFV